ncbi:hypothetical protein Ancab_025152 [Ancistrocladus abbreviatus]
MKITPNTDLSTLRSSKPPQILPARDHPDLPNKTPPRKPLRRKTTRTPRLATAKKDGVPPSRRPGPPTPLLRWKLNERQRGDVFNVADEKSPDVARKSKKGKGAAQVSARKLGAMLWRIRSLEIGVIDGDNGGGGERSAVRKNGDRLGFKPGVGHGEDQLYCYHGSRGYGSEEKDPLRSPCSITGPINGYLCEPQPSFQFPNYAMEGATKWNPVYAMESNENSGRSQLLDSKLNAVSVVSTLQAELQQAQARIGELETEQRSSKKKLEHFLKKLSEERAAWRSREHEKVRAFIDDIKAELNREKKNRQRLDIVNSKLVNELAEAKLSTKRYMQDYEKERKARELIEEVCDELVEEIGEDKAEVEALKKECMKIREEVEDERKMLQIAEVWREERVQMKLVDAKVTLEEKYSEIDKLVTELENFLKPRTPSSDLKDVKEAEMLRQDAAAMKIHDIKEFTYEPPKPDDIFSIFEEMTTGEHIDREIEPSVAYSPASHSSKIHTVSPEVKNRNKNDTHRFSMAYLSQNGDMEDDKSGWETVSHIDDQDSSYSPEGSTPSVNRMQQDSNASGSCTDWEENGSDKTPITEINEVCLVPTMQLKKVSSISRLWRSCPNNNENCKIISMEGMSGRLSNGRISSQGIISPDVGPGQGGFSPSDRLGEWSSPDLTNPHLSQGMKGCIEWPRGMQKHSLKAKLLEARMESQKVQLRQVLKQKI